MLKPLQTISLPLDAISNIFHIFLLAHQVHSTVFTVKALYKNYLPTYLLVIIIVVVFNILETTRQCQHLYH